MLALAPKPGRAEYPATLIDRLWWKPKAIAYYDRSWKTLPYAKYTAIAKWKASRTLSASPLDVDGKAHFLAFDVDCGIGVVRKILEVLPPGTKPLISRSGGRGGEGFHLWLFLDQPVDVQTAVSFLRLVLAKAKISDGVEIFPSSKSARPLKLPGSLHPETNVCEDFVNLATCEEHDTWAVWQALFDGLYRSSAQAIEKYVANYQQEAKPAPKQHRQAKARTAREATAWLASQEKLCDHLMQLAGRQPVAIGKAFRCILPGHLEKHPSAAFHRTEDGRIMYHDFHSRDGESWYTLGEVFYALTTGEVRKLKRHEAARWLAMLALQAGVFSEAAAATLNKLETLSSTFFKFLQKAFPEVPSVMLEELESFYRGEGIIRLVGCKALGEAQTEARRNPTSTGEVLLRVWQVIALQALVVAQANLKEIPLSKRFLAEQARIAGDMANRAINLLCCLGFLQKVPASGGRKGDRYVLGEASLEEALRRWHLLGAPSLREFKASLVAAKLGEETARAIFRRAAGSKRHEVKTEAGLVEKRNQSGNQNELAAIEAAIRRLVKEIEVAEKGGDMERATSLLPKVVGLAKKKKALLLGGAGHGFAAENVAANRSCL
ncbi:MAG: hypothetical protein ACPL5F_13715 [Moorellaceae bacterium]